MKFNTMYISIPVYEEERLLSCRMYVVVYYIVFAMGNESTIVNSKKIQILYYCLSLQCMIQQSIWFDHQEVRLTYTDINMDIGYL